MSNSYIVVSLIIIFCSFGVTAHDGDHKQITESCVLGNLPQEIQFKLEGNPVYLSGDKLELESIELLAQQLDGRLKRLFRKAVGNSKKIVKAKGWKPYSVNYLEELAFQIYMLSKDEFDVGFCGDSKVIDSFLYAQIFDYIDSATNSDIGFPNWVKELGPIEKKHRNLILVTALGLHLSNENHDDYLVLFKD